MNSAESQPDRIKQQVDPRNSSLIKPILPEVVGDLPNEDRTEKLFNIMATVIWSRGVLNQYNDLPRGKSRERKIVNNLVTKTATQLLENPLDISIVERAWNTNGVEQDEPQEPQEPLSELVRKERLALIKDKWDCVTPGQLAQLVRIYANNDPSKDSAKDLLRSYFKGPKSRNQRIDAYYNFVLGVLDLAGENEVFREGMKIVLYATDILPKDPSLVEQVVLVSLPYKEDDVFQKAIIANYIICQLRFMGLQDFAKYYDDRNTFANKGIAVRQEMRKKEQRMIKEIGLDEARRLNRATESFFYALIEPLTEERKQSLKGTWPFNLAFDETDPLNQKFQKVLA